MFMEQKIKNKLNKGNKRKIVEYTDGEEKEWVLGKSDYKERVCILLSETTVVQLAAVQKPYCHDLPMLEWQAWYLLLAAVSWQYHVACFW